MFDGILNYDREYGWHFKKTRNFGLSDILYKYNVTAVYQRAQSDIKGPNVNRD